MMHKLKNRLLVTKFLRRFPIETYVVFLSSAVIFLTIHLVNSITQRWNIPIDPRAVLMGPLIGEGFLQRGVLILLVYAGCVLVYYFVTKDSAGKTGIERARNDPRFFVVARSACFWFLLLCAFVAAAGAAFAALYTSFSFNEMANASNLIMSFDKTLFGIYPPFYIHTLSIHTDVQIAFAEAYAYTPALLGILFGFLFCYDRQLCRNYFLSLVISTFISFPFWITFPAIPPNEMYRLNILHQSISTEIQQGVSRVILSPRIDNLLDAVERMWFDHNEKSFSVSEFPSSHVIWATIFLYAAFRVRWWFGGIASVFYVANFIATIFLMEHYAVDALLGALVALISIYFSHLLLAFDKAYLNDELKLLSIFDSLSIKNFRLHILKKTKNFIIKNFILSVSIFSKNIS